MTLSNQAHAWFNEHGFNPLDPDDTGRYSDTPLILASRQGKESIVDELLANGADVNRRNMDGTNALWAAIVANHFVIAEKLVEAGIDIDNINDNGATALMYASSAGKAPWVWFLLKKGARTDCETLDGFTALDLASTLDCLRLLRGRDKLSVTKATEKPVKKSA